MPGTCQHTTVLLAGHTRLTSPQQVYQHTTSLLPLLNITGEQEWHGIPTQPRNWHPIDNYQPGGSKVSPGPTWPRVCFLCPPFSSTFTFTFSLSSVLFSRLLLFPLFILNGLFYTPLSDSTPLWAPPPFSCRTDLRELGVPLLLVLQKVWVVAEHIHHRQQQWPNTCCFCCHDWLQQQVGYATYWHIAVPAILTTL